MNAYLSNTAQKFKFSYSVVSTRLAIKRQQHLELKSIAEHIEKEKYVYNIEKRKIKKITRHISSQVCINASI